MIEIKNVSRVFQEGSLPVTALSELSLEIPEGSFTALCGPSGSGKTTLLNMIGCLDRPSTGNLFLDGEDVSRLPQKALSRIRLNKIGFIFQDFNLVPTLSAIENIEYVLWLQGVASAERRKRALEVCQRFGIEKLVHRRPSQISRGQQQRVAVARALVHNPKIVLGDELTANLDHKTGIALMDFLKELNQEKKMTFIYASHDPVMIECAEKVIRLQDGKLIHEHSTRFGS
ncbi:MAG TPA: ABC transporter ATP-binding protein [Verrucomicrobiae bacterium]|nr:ABC transporter ATP-binding protein [Verrucomicrobiae bacterium]